MLCHLQNGRIFFYTRFARVVALRDTRVCTSLANPLVLKGNIMRRSQNYFEVDSYFVEFGIFLNWCTPVNSKCKFLLLVEKQNISEVQSSPFF